MLHFPNNVPFRWYFGSQSYSFMWRTTVWIGFIVCLWRRTRPLGIHPWDCNKYCEEATTISFGASEIHTKRYPSTLQSMPTNHRLPPLWLDTTTEPTQHTSTSMSTSTASPSHRNLLQKIKDNNMDEEQQRKIGYYWNNFFWVLSRCCY